MNEVMGPLPALIVSVIAGLLPALHVEGIVLEREAAASDLLVLVSDHGTGSTALAGVLDHHPCIFSFRQPFSPSEKLASSTGKKALLRFDGVPGDVPKALKLVENIDLSMRHHHYGTERVPFKSNLHLKQTTPLAYFSAVRAHLCEYTQLPLACRGRCVLAHQMFPEYIDSNYTYIRDYLVSKQTEVAHLQRNENDRQRSNHRQFGTPVTNASISPWDLFLLDHRNDRGKTWLHLNMEKIWKNTTSYMHAIERIIKPFKGLNQESLMLPVKTAVESEFKQLRRRQRAA